MLNYCYQVVFPKPKAIRLQATLNKGWIVGSILNINIENLN